MTETPAATGTLLRGLSLVDHLADHAQGATVSELARIAGLDKSTVSRLLAALREAGYVQQQQDRSYRLSGKILRIARAYLDHFDLRRVAQPHLLDLRDRVNETIHLAIREDAWLIYVDQVEPNHNVQVRSSVGARRPLHATSMGRAILATFPEPQRKTVIESLLDSPETHNIAEDRETLDASIEMCSRLGWATIDRHDDVLRVGAAILDVTGESIAGVSVSGPAYRLAPNLHRAGEECRRTAELISEELGYRKLATAGPTSDKDRARARRR
jgi:DNA-binding IclR family transcriptional regulator